MWSTRPSPALRLFNVFLAFAMLISSQMLLAVPPAQAATNTLNVANLNVVSARTEPRAGVTRGDLVNDFRYIINVDNTGTTQTRSPSGNCAPGVAGYPNDCDWVSIAGSASNSPVYTQGDQSDFAGDGLTLPDGRYLISVLADGYKLDGAHFTMPLDGSVNVGLQPFPLPDATIRAFVFEDVSPTNGAPDVPAENGLAGFVGHIADYLGEVTTDVYGNPLCTRYQGEDPDTFVVPASALDADMAPIPVPGTGGQCVSDANGNLAIPHLGPNRYALSAVAPDGTNWIQTTTLEGNHDWDAWVMEGSTGYDTEFVVAGEPFPAIIFGFVKPSTPNLGGTGQIKGVVDAFKTYVPAKGGVIGGEPMTGSRIDKPIDSPWIALSDLQAGDTAIWIGQGDANGAFNIPNVPNGNYTLTWWDEPQDYILNLTNVTVANGEVVDLGVIPLNGWWTTLEGYVFTDSNRNGVRDPGEQGVPGFPVAMRKRENSLMDRGAVIVTTDGTGHYYMENLYPMTQWLVVEAYSDGVYTTGITYQADNQPEPTTIIGAGVDVNVLPIIGLSGTLDWGVHPYAPFGQPGVDPDNGGIVGTVSYDTTRNEIDPRFAAVEDWQPGISDLTVNLYAPVDCPEDGLSPCDPTGFYQLDTDGSVLKGQLLNSTLTETWERPGLNDDGNCVARDVNGDPLVYGVDQLVTNSPTDCLEGPLMGVQFQAGYATVDGNYGFGDGCFNGTLDATDPDNLVCVGGTFDTLTAGDYLVEVVVPDDATGRPLYQVTKEEDINIANGDQFVPQVPPSPCAGPLHTVDVDGIGTDVYPENATFIDGVTIPASTPVVNSTFAEDLNGSYYEGQPKPLCDTKLVTLGNGKSVAPLFNFFTEVPLPGRFWGLLVDDLNFSANLKSLSLGEKAGVPFAPVGIYDWTNRLITTVESDYNGLWDVLLPSSNRINCPTPSGVCANLFRAVGNDPGIPGRLNLNYRPEFRTIAAEFESIPGLIVPADLAPTQVGLTAQLPGGQFNLVSCPVNALDTSPTKPELLAVSRPYVDFRTSTTNNTFTITGQGFGTTGQVTLDGTALPTTAWSDTSISVTVPVTTAVGPHQLEITRTDNGNSTVNGLTFHVLGTRLPAFSATPVLDNFNRTGFGNNWNTSNAFSLSNNNVRVAGTGNNTSGTMRWGGSSGGGPVYGPNQEAYFTFVKVSPSATEQGLFLKVTGNGNNPDPTSDNSAYIEVSYKGTSPNSVQVRTKRSGTSTVVLQATFPATFAATDQLGARTLADGTVIAYKNAVEIGRVNVVTNPALTAGNRWLQANAAAGGRLGVRFVGVNCNNGNCTNGNDARFDDFGGGTITPVAYPANLYEVGPGRTYTTIQSAIDAAESSAGTDLVVVYPGQPDLTNPRNNPRGAYYENLVVASPIKLQGVGPGGFQGSTYVPGSIIDGAAFGGDTTLAEAWRTRVFGLQAGTGWVGNQTVSEGEVILMLATSANQYGAAFKAAVDGFGIRGGDQQGQANIITQGGAIFANAYVRNLQITNNEVVGNSSSYGTIRIGTPDLPAPDTNQHNENLRIADNRIIQNAGTNLGGGIALYAGSDNYEVAGNDICGNFSAEYGGGMTAYGFSPGGRIHDNRIYFNQSYDEGGGIMIAGQLPANPTSLSPGSGPVDIYNNLIQNNMANDDGGGLRFLMAGNFPINVYNNMIVDNVSTHEGGGIGINDAPAVRVFNNTIMKNVTTATALTSNGQPAPAGLSTSANSDQLQATLPGGASSFSDPLLFNNVFWDNRAGSLSGGTVTGLGAPGDPTPINRWDLGVADGTGSLSPTNSTLQVTTGTNPSATNSTADPSVLLSYDVSVTFAAWRNNPNFVGAVMVVNDLPPNLLGNYHLGAGSPAIDLGAAGKASVSAPAFDIDNQPRPAGGGFDAGADEVQ